MSMSDKMDRENTFLAEVLSRSASFKMSWISFLSCSFVISSPSPMVRWSKMLCKMSLITQMIIRWSQTLNCDYKVRCLKIIPLSQHCCIQAFQLPAWKLRKSSPAQQLLCCGGCAETSFGHLRSFRPVGPLFPIPMNNIL